MKDRVPVNPGRVLITPENGSAAFYATMTRADNPTQEGTPLNKNSLLKDETAALYGFGDSALPDDISRVMARLHNKLGNEYLWARRGYIPPSSTMTSKGKTRLFSFDYYMTVNLADSFTVDDAGVVTLTNPTSQSMSTVAGAKQHLPGKYFTVTDGVLGSVNKTDVYFCPANAEFASTASGEIYYITVSDLYVITGIAAVTEGLDYVNSPNPNAYPPAEDDGFTYQALGMLGEKVRIATGSYTGTGTYGSANPCALTFNFAPKLVIIVMTKYTGNNKAQSSSAASTGSTTSRVGFWGKFFAILTYPATQMSVTNGSYDAQTTQITWGENSVSWYTTATNQYEVDGQWNNSGFEYCYIAFG